ncbi:MAG: hypothetical protein ACK4UN_00230 [Limisphaerales bacterium]
MMPRPLHLGILKWSLLWSICKTDPHEESLFLSQLLLESCLGSKLVLSLDTSLHLIAKITRRVWTDGLMDTVLSLKGRLLSQEHYYPISLSAEGTVKVPTASRARDLGTGETDLGFVLIATRSWSQTSIDLNVGYTLSRVFRGQREGDQMFYGGAIRHPIGERWQLFTEVFAESDTNDFSDTVLMGRAGFQTQIASRLLYSAAAGTGLRRGSPDFTATTGFTFLF